MKYNFNSSNALIRRRYVGLSAAETPQEAPLDSHLYLNTDFQQQKVHTSALQRFHRFQEKLHRSNRRSTPKKHATDQFVVSAFTVAVVQPHRLEDPLPQFTKHESLSRQLVDLERDYFSRLRMSSSNTVRVRRSQESGRKTSKKLNIHQDNPRKSPKRLSKREASNEQVLGVVSGGIQDTNFSKYSNRSTRLIPRLPVNPTELQNPKLTPGTPPKSLLKAAQNRPLKSSPRRTNTARKKPELEEGIELKPWEDFAPE